MSRIFNDLRYCFDSEIDLDGCSWFHRDGKVKRGNLLIEVYLAGLM